MLIPEVQYEGAVPYMDVGDGILLGNVPVVFSGEIDIPSLPEDLDVSDRTGLVAYRPPARPPKLGPDHAVFPYRHITGWYWGWGTTRQAGLQWHLFAKAWKRVLGDQTDAEVERLKGWADETAKGGDSAEGA